MNTTKQRLYEMMEKVNPDFKTALNEEDSCWRGYKQYGMKEKNGKEVPNCVPVNEQQPTTGALPPTTQSPVGTSTQSTKQPKIAGDVARLQNVSKYASGVQSAQKRINTTTEFPQAFKVWFSSLGYNPENKSISIGRVLTDIRKAMQELGYK